MKQYEYMTRFDKDTFDGGNVNYVIEVSTNNHSCYQEIKDVVTQIVTEYETKEAADDNGNQD